MNLSESVKEEIFSKKIKEEHCRKAFIAGMLRGNGVLFEDDDGYGLTFNTAGEDRAMRVVALIRSAFSVDVREISVSEDRLNKRDLFRVTVTGKDAENLLFKTGIIKKVGEETRVNFDFFGDLDNRDCCFQAFMRGLFVSCGSCTAPSESSVKTGYHLEMVFSHSAPAQQVCDVLGERGIFGNITRRKGNYVYYIKSSDSVSDFLALLGASVSVLKLTDLIIERDIFNRSNRIKNCDLGNLNRQVEASEKILKAIEKIEKGAGLDSLKEELKTLAETKKKYPDDSVAELAERLDLSKSCVRHRLRNIIRASETVTEDKK